MMCSKQRILHVSLMFAVSLPGFRPTTNGILVALHSVNEYKTLEPLLRIWRLAHTLIAARRRC